MNIKANNIQNFKKQFHQRFNGEELIDLDIKLETDDNFWKDITQESYNSIIQSSTFLGITPPDFKNIKQLYVFNYGNIERVNGVFTFSAQKDLKKDEEFQQTKEIDMIVTKDLKVAPLAEMKEKRDFNIKMNKEFPWWSV